MGGCGQLRGTGLHKAIGKRLEEDGRGEEGGRDIQEGRRGGRGVRQKGRKEVKERREGREKYSEHIYVQTRVSTVCNAIPCVEREVWEQTIHKCSICNLSIASLNIQSVSCVPCASPLVPTLPDQAPSSRAHTQNQVAEIARQKTWVLPHWERSDWLAWRMPQI